MTQTIDNTLKEGYLRWLEPQLKDEHGSSKTYWDLIHLMFKVPFAVLVTMDENRLADGLDLRVEFAREQNFPPRHMRQLGPCTFLEVLIGLSRRLSFVAGGSAPGWAWKLMDNLTLNRLSDPLSRTKHDKALTIIDVVTMRKYRPDGMGGFFPLAWPNEDQREIELWYQLNSYAEELHPEH